MAMDYLNSYARTVVDIPVERSDHIRQTRSSVGFPSPFKPTTITVEEYVNSLITAPHSTAIYHTLF